MTLHLTRKKKQKSMLFCELVKAISYFSLAHLLCLRKKGWKSSWPTERVIKFHEFKNFLKETSNNKTSNNKPFPNTYFWEKKKIIFNLKDYFIYFKHQLNADGPRDQSSKLLFLFHFKWDVEPSEQGFGSSTLYLWTHLFSNWKYIAFFFKCNLICPHLHRKNAFPLATWVR